MSETAWLAGFWDGEGSIGIAKNKSTFVMCCQLSLTCRDTIIYIMGLLDKMGVTNRGYTYQERDPTKHRDAHYIRVNGINNIVQFGKKLEPYSILKKRHWQVAIEYGERRIEKAGGLYPNGHLKKSGIPIPYCEKDIALIEELCFLNMRGPRGAHKRGRIHV